MLERTKAQVLEERQAKKAPLKDAEVRALLGRVREVVIAKGRASRVLPAAQATLADLRGPTGNFRAPMVLKGERLLVGFSLAALEELLGAG